VRQAGGTPSRYRASRDPRLPGDALDLNPRLPEIYDESFADVSQIRTFPVASLTRREVTGGALGGRRRRSVRRLQSLFLGPQLRRAVRRWPRPIRQGCAGLLTAISPERWDAGFERVNGWLPGSLHRPTPGTHPYKLAGLLAVDQPVSTMVRSRTRFLSRLTAVALCNQIRPIRRDLASLVSQLPVLKSFDDPLHELSRRGRRHS
jgi:hypothetical protein